MAKTKWRELWTKPVNNPVCYPPLPSPPSYIIYVQHCKLPCLNYVTHCVGILCHAEDVTRFVECACVTIQVFEEFIVNASKNRTFFIGARKSCPTSDAKSLAVPRLAGEGACRIKHGNALGKWISRRGRRIREKRITRRPVLYVICCTTQRMTTQEQIKRDWRRHYVSRAGIWEGVRLVLPASMYWQQWGVRGPIFGWFVPPIIRTWICK